MLGDAAAKDGKARKKKKKHRSVDPAEGSRRLSHGSSSKASHKRRTSSEAPSPLSINDTAQQEAVGGPSPLPVKHAAQQRVAGGAPLAVVDGSRPLPVADGTEASAPSALALTDDQPETARGADRVDLAPAALADRQPVPALADRQAEQAPAPSTLALKDGQPVTARVVDRDLAPAALTDRQPEQATAQGAPLALQDRALRAAHVGSDASPDSAPLALADASDGQAHTKLQVEDAKLTEQGGSPARRSVVALAYKAKSWLTSGRTASRLTKGASSASIVHPTTLEREDSAAPSVRFADDIGPPSSAQAVVGQDEPLALTDAAQRSNDAPATFALEDGKQLPLANEPTSTLALVSPEDSNAASGARPMSESFDRARPAAFSDHLIPLNRSASDGVGTRDPASTYVFWPGRSERLSAPDAIGDPSRQRARTSLPKVQHGATFHGGGGVLSSFSYEELMSEGSGSAGSLSRGAAAV